LIGPSGLLLVGSLPSTYLRQSPVVVAVGWVAGSCWGKC
jgi:hypothetical protein